MYDLFDDLLLSTPVDISALNTLIDAHNKAIRVMKINKKPGFKENSQFNIAEDLGTDDELHTRLTMKTTRDNLQQQYMRLLAEKAFVEISEIDSEVNAVVFNSINFDTNTFKCGDCGEESDLVENPFQFLCDSHKNRLPYVVKNYCDHCGYLNTVDPFTFKEIVDSIKGPANFIYETLGRSAMEMLVPEIEYINDEGFVEDTSFVPDYDCWVKDYLDKVYLKENKGTLKEYLGISGLNVRDYAGSLNQVYNDLGSSVGSQVRNLDLKRLKESAPAGTLYDFYRKVHIPETKILDISNIGFLVEGDGVFPGDTKEATYAMLPYYVEYFIDYLNKVDHERNKALISLFHSNEIIKHTNLKFITANSRTLAPKLNEYLPALRSLDLDLPEILLEYLGLKIPFEKMENAKERFFALMGNYNPREFMFYLVILKAVVVEYPNRTFGELYTDIESKNYVKDEELVLYSTYHPLLQIEDNIADLKSGKADADLIELALFENPELEGRI